MPRGMETKTVHCSTSPPLQSKGGRSCHRKLPKPQEPLRRPFSHPLTTLHLAVLKKKKTTVCAVAVLFLSLNLSHLASKPQKLLFYSGAPLDYLFHKC